MIIQRIGTFCPSEYLGPDATIWRGPLEWSGMAGNEAQEPESLNLDRIDICALRWTNGLVKGEQWISTIEKLRRLSEGPEDEVLLDAGFAAALYRQEGQVALEKIFKDHGYICLEFAGTIVRLPPLVRGHQARPGTVCVSRDGSRAHWHMWCGEVSQMLCHDGSYMTPILPQCF